MGTATKRLQFRHRKFRRRRLTPEAELASPAATRASPTRPEPPTRQALSTMLGCSHALLQEDRQSRRPQAMAPDAEIALPALRQTYPQVHRRPGPGVRAKQPKPAARPKNVMTINQVRAALEKLDNRGYVKTLMQLNEVRQNPARAANLGYQRKFKGYYRMRQKRPDFYQHFFATLQAAASAPSPPSLAKIMQELYDKTKERHLSFASKLLASVTDDEVVFDRLVANYFRVPSNPLPPNSKDWLAKLLRRHDLVAQGVQNFIRAPDWPQMRALFDKKFPDAQHLPDIRKADLIIWAAGDAPLTGP